MTLAHRLHAGASVQALALLDNDCLIAGLQGGNILVWSLGTYQALFTLHAHDESVLSLYVSDDGNLLFSSGVDSVVNVWSTSTFQRLYTIHSHFEIGDLFSVVYSSHLQTVFCGAQDQSIQWCNINLQESTPTPASATLPNNRKHRFFDSLGPGGSTPPRFEDDDDCGRPHWHGGRILSFKKRDYLPFAHDSYIYSMILVKGLYPHDLDEEVLVTGGGDGAIKLWAIDGLNNEGLLPLAKFKNANVSVLSMTCNGIFLYAGFSDGKAAVYNLDSRQFVQKLDVKCGDVGTIQVIRGQVVCGTSGGFVKRFNPQLTEMESWPSHNGKILASVMAQVQGRDMFINGGNDNSVAFWDLTDSAAAISEATPHGNDDLVNSLRDFVAYKSISANKSYIGECNKAATYLRKLFTIFQANTSFLPAPEGINPILLASFEASSQPSRKKTVLFYGHYDVVDAEYDPDEKEPRWHADPFHLHPLNGFLYGRGVTDNKAPILAALYAVADLVKGKELNCNIIFLIEGEEEAGSRGFAQSVEQNRDRIGDVDHILLANSYWLDDHIPCLTYGMRGVIHATLTVSSGKPDRHSGMDGKAAAHEPLKDLTRLLSHLTEPNGTGVNIPGFQASVPEMSAAEKSRYSAITSALMPGHPEIKDASAFAESLSQRWREPNLTIHRIEVPESKTAVTIPRFAKVSLSIRIVPGQDAETIAADLVGAARREFLAMGSTNKLEVHIASKADAWLGDPSNEIFQALEAAITEVWTPKSSSSSSDSITTTPSTMTARSFPHQPSTFSSSPRPPATQTHNSPPHRRSSTLATRGSFTAQNMPRGPLYIREGGSIPAIAFLEREFAAPAAMFPLGQASDNAHLDNERMRVENLHKGREVFRRVFKEL